MTYSASTQYMLDTMKRLLATDSPTGFTRQATDLCVKEFENIGQGLFSMHLTGAGFNIRVLFAFLSNNQPVLLHAFEEKQGKRRTDYSSHIPPALLRLSQTKEDFKNGFI